MVNAPIALECKVLWNRTNQEIFYGRYYCCKKSSVEDGAFGMQLSFGPLSLIASSMDFGIHRIIRRCDEFMTEHRPDGRILNSVGRVLDYEIPISGVLFLSSVLHAWWAFWPLL